MTIWFIARAAGLSAFLAFSVSTGLGAAGARAARTPGRRVVLQYIHRSAALTGLLLLVTHIVLLVLDSYAKVGVRGALVPFTAGYRPLAVGLGTLAMYCIVAAAVTGMLRGRLANSSKAARWWRPIHLTAYAAWISSAIHFLMAGTDVGRWWSTVVFLGGLAFVATGVTARLASQPPATSTFRQAVAR